MHTICLQNCLRRVSTGNTSTHNKWSLIFYAVLLDGSCGNATSNRLVCPIVDSAVLTTHKWEEQSFYLSLKQENECFNQITSENIR